MPTTPEAVEEPAAIVFDTTVLSNFASVKQISLLQDLYTGRALTTLMVLSEIEDGLLAGYEYLQDLHGAVAPANPAGWLRVAALETAGAQNAYLELAAHLGPGEASCLALAHTRKLVLATDDLAARRQAAALDVRLTGTIGILLRAVRERRLPLPQANDTLAQMIELRYRSPVSRLDDLL